MWYDSISLSCSYSKRLQNPIMCYISKALQLYSNICQHGCHCAIYIKVLLQLWWSCIWTRPKINHIWVRENPYGLPEWNKFISMASDFVGNRLPFISSRTNLFILPRKQVHFSSVSEAKADLMPTLPSSSINSPLWIGIKALKFFHNWFRVKPDASEALYHSLQWILPQDKPEQIYFAELTLLGQFTWGIVGQLLNSLMPCLSSSSASTLWPVKVTSCIRIIWQT